jgi:hypothetical protein
MTLAPWLAKHESWQDQTRRLAAEPAPWDLWIARETMRQSEPINELAAALAKAQAKVKAALKDSANPFYKSKYADLASVWDACRDALTSNGLSIAQSPETTFPDGRAEVAVTTRLMHLSGQWLEGTVAARLDKTDPQAVGSAVTYLRRYGLQSMVGVAPEDDDGEAAASRGKEEPRKPPRPFGVNEDGEHVIPGKPASWGGFGGKALTDPDVPANVLNALHKWLLNPPGDFNAETGPLLRAVEAEIEKRGGNGKPPVSETPQPQGTDDFLMMRMQLTKLMKGTPELFSAADEKAMRSWIDEPGRTFPEVAQRVADVQDQVDKHQAEKEAGKQRAKAPRPA